MKLVYQTQNHCVVKYLENILRHGHILAHIEKNNSRRINDYAYKLYVQDRELSSASVLLKKYLEDKQIVEETQNTEEDTVEWYILSEGDESIEKL